jgi:uncharacterized protein (UPF0332 family)
MKFDWSEYFYLAEEMAGVSPPSSSSTLATHSTSDISEAKLRSAISRAYYASFCKARNYLRDIEHDPRLSKARIGDINEHKYVVDELVNNRAKNKKLIEIGKDLGRLREYRNKSDYEDVVYSLEKEVKMSLKLAKNIISSLARLTENSES